MYKCNRKHEQKERKVSMPETEDSYSKFEKTQKKFRSSDKGKAVWTRFNLSDKGKDARKKYLESENGRKALLRYYLSQKAETTRQQRQALIKLFRRLDKYLKSNPDKTMEDFLT